MRTATLIALMILGNLTGCSFKGENAGAISSQANPDTSWKITATQMRIYPSTRFVRIEDELVLEARVEFMDELGDSIKASGTFVFEVFDAEREIDAVDAKRLYSWRVEMLTKETNREYYDPVTRAYLIRLSTDQLPANQKQVVFKVMFDRPNARSMSAANVVKVQ